jgi:hypothetical protein
MYAWVTSNCTKVLLKRNKERKKTPLLIEMVHEIGVGEWRDVILFTIWTVFMFWHIRKLESLDAWRNKHAL